MKRDATEMAKPVSSVIDISGFEVVDTEALKKAEQRAQQREAYRKRHAHEEKDTKERIVYSGFVEIDVFKPLDDPSQGWQLLPELAKLHVSKLASDIRWIIEETKTPYAFSRSKGNAWARLAVQINAKGPDTERLHDCSILLMLPSKGPTSEGVLVTYEKPGEVIFSSACSRVYYHKEHRALKKARGMSVQHAISLIRLCKDKPVAMFSRAYYRLVELPQALLDGLSPGEKAGYLSLAREVDEDGNYGIDLREMRQSNDEPFIVKQTSRLTREPDEKKKIYDDALRYAHLIMTCPDKIHRPIQILYSDEAIQLWWGYINVVVRPECKTLAYRVEIGTMALDGMFLTNDVSQVWQVLLDAEKMTRDEMFAKYDRPQSTAISFTE